MTRRMVAREASLDERVSQLRAIAERVEEDLLAARHLVEGILAGCPQGAAAYSRPWSDWLAGARACHDELVRLADAVDTARPSR